MAKTKWVRLSNPSTKDLVVIEEHLYKLKDGIFRNWILSPDYCLCERKCMCDRYEIMTDDQLKSLDAHLKEVKRLRKEKEPTTKKA